MTRGPSERDRCANPRAAGVRIGRTDSFELDLPLAKMT